MSVLWLHVQAPFAAYRWMQAGVYRASSPTMPPSAAYGLLLNLAGIEMRADIEGVTTLIRKDLPPLSIAIGALGKSGTPEVSTLYQQLHSYPVGNSGKELEARTKGAKFWIVPVRRELLVGLNVVIGVTSPDEALLAQIAKGVRGELDMPRYGLPFAGDNNLLFDRIEILPTPTLARWYSLLAPDSAPRKGSCRLTVAIDRADNSQSKSLLYAPLETPCEEPPDNAWTWVPESPQA
jgi:CRISPR-associated protein Cas5t